MLINIICCSTVRGEQILMQHVHDIDSGEVSHFLCYRLGMGTLAAISYSQCLASSTDANVGLMLGVCRP